MSGQPASQRPHDLVVQAVVCAAIGQCHSWSQVVRRGSPCQAERKRLVHSRFGWNAKADQVGVTKTVFADCFEPIKRRHWVQVREPHSGKTA